MNKARLAELEWAKQVMMMNQVAADMDGTTTGDQDFSKAVDIIVPLIDAEIARQSVTDEAVQRAIKWAEQEHKNSFRYMLFGDADSATLAITALQAYQPTTRKDRIVEED